MSETGRPEPTKVTRCRICGRRLTAPESVKKGIGPVCERRLKRREALTRKLEEWSEENAENPVTAAVEAMVLPPGPDPDSEPLPVCPRCGRPSPNPNYCVYCGAPMKPRRLEAVA